MFAFLWVLHSGNKTVGTRKDYNQMHLCWGEIPFRIHQKIPHKNKYCLSAAACFDLHCELFTEHIVQNQVDIKSYSALWRNVSDLEIVCIQMSITLHMLWSTIIIQALLKLLGKNKTINVSSHYSVWLFLVMIKLPLSTFTGIQTGILQRKVY